MLSFFVFNWLVRRAREFGAVRNAQSGAVTFIQRFDSAFAPGPPFPLPSMGYTQPTMTGRPQFQPLLAPENEEIQRLESRSTATLGS